MANQPRPTFSVAQQKTFLGHPVGLFVLFFTEMWERFNYYGMRALLLIYMTNHLLWAQSRASGTQKWYTSLTYLTPLIGGFLADRFLGNKWAIVIGASLMAAGQFVLATDHVETFYLALVLLIVGNGFFKPNMSTQVGRLYATGDPRRDGAYTIFYMGINLGAFIAPIICAAFRSAPGFGFSWGFGAAGVGMIIGLATYLFGLPLIQELPPGTMYEGAGDEKKKSERPVGVLTEDEARARPSVVPALAKSAPTLLTIAAIIFIGGGLALGALQKMPWDSALGLGGGLGVSCLLTAWVVTKLQGALRDRVLAIMAVGIFVTAFWAAFEQASSSMTTHADKITNRYVTQTPPTPSFTPEVDTQDAAPTDQSLVAQILGVFKNLLSINPVNTETFQSINPFAIFLLAPLFAWLWTALPRWGLDLSIPAKMATGVFFNGMAFALMLWSVQFENRPSQTALAALPPGIFQNAEGQVAFRDAPDLKATDDEFTKFAQPPRDGQAGALVGGGRIRFDKAATTLHMSGVLADTERDRLLRATVPGSYLQAVRSLAQQSAKAAEVDAKNVNVSVKLDPAPEGFDVKYAGLPADKVTFDAGTQTLTARIKLEDRDYKRLLLAGADSKFRESIRDIYVKSAQFKVSVWWLFWFYILSTVGELCLSPVGLSMVSKLAPAAYATMLMGMWHLTSFFGNFLAGLAGESWGTVHPFNYFAVITAILFGASLLCYLVSRFIVKLMHGAK